MAKRQCYTISKGGEPKIARDESKRINTTSYCGLKSSSKDIRIERHGVPEEMPLTSCTAVKTNPLFLSPGHREEGDTSRQKCEAYLLLQETPVFFGQRRIIRKTKEQEVAMAVTSIKGKGRSTLKFPSILGKMKFTGNCSSVKCQSRSQPCVATATGRQKSHLSMGGPFILRRRPLHTSKQ